MEKLCCGQPTEIVGGGIIRCLDCPRSATSAPSASTPPAPARHPNSARFHELLKEVGELHDLKQSDYGSDDDPFANVRASEEWGIDGWVGTMVRLHDKVRRLQSLAKKGRLNNEAAIDSFMDIACYAVIARVLYEQDSGGI